MCIKPDKDIPRAYPKFTDVVSLCAANAGAEWVRKRWTFFDQQFHHEGNAFLLIAVESIPPDLEFICVLDVPQTD